MALGNSLFQARKNKGLSQEEVAEKLGISRQTISKWETDETLPDIRQSKRLALLYGLSLDELIDFDVDIKEIQDIIDRTSDTLNDKVDWTKAWSKKYPILAQYQSQVDTRYYSAELLKLLIDLEKQYGYSELDSMLVLKDILASVWKKTHQKTAITKRPNRYRFGRFVFSYSSTRSNRQVWVTSGYLSWSTSPANIS